MLISLSSAGVWRVCAVASQSRQHTYRRRFTSQIAIWWTLLLNMGIYDIDRPYYD
jgi:hypothetical protein